MPASRILPYEVKRITCQVTEVLSEVNILKDRQEDTDTKLETMKMENEALWQEVRTLF